MDFALDDIQSEMKSTAREFAEKRVRPHALEFDEQESLPDDLLAELAELGYMGIKIPEQYGGMELDDVCYGVVIEEFSNVCAGLGITVAVHNTLCAGAVVNFATDEQKQRFLPALAGGEIGAYCLTEPDAGTDAASIRTRVERKGDRFVINGSKMFVTSAGYAKHFIVFARLADAPDPKHAISCLYVDLDTPGLIVGAKEKKLGIRSSDTRAVTFEDCEVDADRLIGEEGHGLKVALTQLDHGRISVAAQALGIAEAAYSEAVAYSKERHQFGRPIADFQAVAFKLADMRVRIDAARLLMYRALDMAAAGKPFTMEASIAKLYASEAANWVANEAVQVHGGYGYMREYPVERYFRDARITELYEGTSEAQRIVISRAVLAEKG